MRARRYCEMSEISSRGFCGRDSLGAVGAAVLRLGALVVQEARAAEGIGHRAVGRGRLSVAAVAALGGSPAPAVVGVAGTAASAVGTGAGAPAVAATALPATPAVTAGTGSAAALSRTRASLGTPAVTGRSAPAVAARARPARPASGEPAPPRLSPGRAEERGRPGSAEPVLDDGDRSASSCRRIVSE